MGKKTDGQMKNRKGGASVQRCVLSVCALLGAAFLTMSFPLSARADIKETQKKLDDAKKAASETKDAIGSNQNTIDSLEDTHSELTGQLADFNSQMTQITGKLNDLDNQITKKQDEIAGTQHSLSDTQETLDETQKSLEEAQKKMADQYAAMKKRVQFIYERGSKYYLQTLIESRSLSEFLSRKEYIEKLSAYDKKTLENYRQLAKEISEKKQEVEKKKEELEQQKASLESQQSDLVGLHSEQKDQQNKVSDLINRTNGSISLTTQQLADANAVADSLQQKLDEQNQQISALEKQLAEEKRLQALSDASVWRDISQITFADGDRYLLANLIYCEAGNQPYEGQVAVGAVVMNRVMSGAFPSTVSGVIYQSWQFEPAATGRLAIALANDEATDACYQAADAAMSGQTPVGNCLFFRTPIPEVTPKYTIGGHIFY